MNAPALKMLFIDQRACLSDQISRVRQASDQAFKLRPLLSNEKLTAALDDGSADALLCVLRPPPPFTGNQEWGPAVLLKGLKSRLNIVANELEYKCSIRKECPLLPDVACVLSQINPFFMNLLVNAAQAIESQGEILLRSGLIDEDQVWVSITDTGKGIPPEHLNRIFKPFFTTKPVGIVNRHHECIEVDSQPGQGTTFRIVLPIRQARADEISSPEVEAT